MPPLNLAGVSTYVETNIGKFHEARIAKISGLTLAAILKGKNPYLFRAKNIKNADELIRSVLDAFLSSGEETMFGNFLEQLAIFINERVYGGKKAGIVGIDLDFEKDGVRWLVSIKSGPNWGNSDAVKKMIDQFTAARQTLRTSGGYKGQIEFVNGCCYGIDDKPEKRRGYAKLCGQRFWSLISGDDALYEELIVPLGHGAKDWNDTIRGVYDAAHAKLVAELHSGGFIEKDGAVDWRKLIQNASQMKD